MIGILNDAIDSSSSGFLFFDKDEKIVRKNSIAIMLIPDLETEASLQSLEGFLDYVFTHKSKTVNFNKYEVFMQKKSFLHAFREVLDVGERTCLVQATEFKSGDTVVFITDISELKANEAQLFQAQKLEALGQLAGGVAHDFNNILSIVDGYARMAEKYAEKGDETLLNYLDRIRQASKRGAGLTKQLLLFGRHKMTENMVIDLPRLIQEQKQLMEPLLSNSIKLVIDVEKGLFVECIPDGLAQILMNLVINSRDAMPDGGIIKIIAKKEDPETILLSVIDTGTGLDPKIADKIFDPFFTTKEQGKGTGLGLSMVYGLVQDMKGVIQVESVPGEGTSMNIYLPFSKKGVIKEITEADGTIRFEGYTALVAEDEPDLLLIVCRFLEDVGMKVIAAANGAEALVRQDDYEGEIDFLLTDVVMPELNGLKLAELVQAVREDIKVVFMSGFPANGTLAQVDIPDDAILLAKPVAFEKLAAVLKSLLDEESPDDKKSEALVYEIKNL